MKTSRHRAARRARASIRTATLVLPLLGWACGRVTQDEAGAGGASIAGSAATLGGQAGAPVATSNGGVSSGGAPTSVGGQRATAGAPGEAGAAQAGAAGCDADCVPAVPTIPPSCDGLPETCGPSASESCCVSPLVQGGTFYRSYDGATYTSMAAPATISDFRLDKYEVTVGRFRKFISAWLGGFRPAPGAGKHAHLNQGQGLNGTEAGWDASWETLGRNGVTKPSLPATLDGWDEALACTGSTLLDTWTPTVGANETLPLTCETFWEGYAFCIWDGGFLPSEAEWNYAASGGAEQRVYPWGSEQPTQELAVFSPCIRGSSGCSLEHPQARVGSRVAGNGRYGQADLGGNMMERVLDTTADYQTPCTDCASLSYSFRGSSGFGNAMTVRGGSAVYDASYLFSSARWLAFSNDRDEYLGIRCARSP